MEQTPIISLLLKNLIPINTFKVKVDHFFTSY